MMMLAVDTLSSIGPPMVQTFGTIYIGYLLARFHIITPDGARALASYVSIVAYPTVMLYALAHMQWSVVVWPFFSATLIARLLMMALTIGFMFSRYGVTAASMADGGIYSMFLSQSSEITIGLPILSGLFAAAHPTWSQMLFIVVLMRLITNPICFYMMEWARQKRNAQRFSEGYDDDNHSQRRAVVADVARSSDIGSGAEEDEEEKESATTASTVTSPALSNLPIVRPASQCQMIASICWQVSINPFVIGSILGLILNFIFGATLPGSIDPLFRTISLSYTPVALIVAGLALHGHFRRLTDRRELKTPLYLFVGKTIISAIVARYTAEFMGLGSISRDLVMFCFILGSMPTSTTLPFYAIEYDVPSQTLIAPALVLGVLLSAPIIFILAQMTLLTLTPNSIDDVVQGTLSVFASFGLAAAAWLIFLLYYNSRRHTIRDQLLLFLLSTQLVLSIGMETCGVSSSMDNLEVLRYVFVFGAQMCARCARIALVANEVVHYYQSREAESRLFRYFVGGSIALSIGMVLFSALAGSHTVAPGLESLECFFRYGRVQWLLLSMLDVCTLILLIYCAWRIHPKSVEAEQRVDAAAAHAISAATASATSYQRVKMQESDDEGEEAHTAQQQVEEQENEQQEQGPASSPARRSTRRDVSVDVATPSSAPESSPTSRYRQPRSSPPPPPPSAGSGFFSSPSTHHHPHPTSHDDDMDMDESEGDRRVSVAEEEASWSFSMTIFILILFGWSILHFILAVWSVIDPLSRADGRLELLLLEHALSGGQAIITYLLFGLASHVRSPLGGATRWARSRVRHWYVWMRS